MVRFLSTLARKCAPVLIALLLLFMVVTDGRAAATTVAPAVGNGMMTVLPNGLYAATWIQTYAGSPSVFYWVDDGKGTSLLSGKGNGLVEPTEVRLLAPGTMAATPAPQGIMVVNGLLCINYTYADGGGLNEYDVWTDLNNDHEVNFTSEVTYSGQTGTVSQIGKMQVFAGHRASLHGAMNVWIDDGRGGGTPDDGRINGTEDRGVFTVTPVGGFLGEWINNKSLGTIAGHMAVHYEYVTWIDEGSGNSREETQIYLWVDDGHGGGIADNQIADGGEIRSLEFMRRDDVNIVNPYGSTGNLFEVGGHAALAYSRVNPVIGVADNYKAAVWIDDGRGGGTANDLIETPGEIRDIEIMQDEGAISTAFPYNGKAALAYVSEGTGGGGKLKFWIDDGNGGGTMSDGVPNGTEIRTIEGPTVDFRGQSLQAGTKPLALFYNKTLSSLRLASVDIPPTLSSINPATGYALGDTAFTLTGGNFFSGTSILVGGVAATNVVYVNDTTLTARTPPHAAGVVDVTVTNTDGLTATLSSAFTYQPNPPPQLSSISPVTGPVFGGSLLTVSGNYFQIGAIVTMGGKPLLNQTRVNSTTIRGTVPSGTEGPVDVTLTNPDASAVTLPGAYTYTLGVTITDVQQSKMYPTPFRPKFGHNAMVINAPDGSTVRVFDLTGNLVKEIHTVGNGALWDVRNESGENLASGIYVYLVTDASGNKFKNRFMVIR